MASNPVIPTAAQGVSTESGVAVTSAPPFLAPLPPIQPVPVAPLVAAVNPVLVSPLTGWPPAKSDNFQHLPIPLIPNWHQIPICLLKTVSVPPRTYMKQ